MRYLFVLLICFNTFVYAFSFFDSNSTDTVVEEKAQSIFLSYEYVPSKVYVGELFKIKVKAIIANDDFEEMTNSFEETEHLTVINPDAKWKWFSDNIFYNTFYMKVDDITAKLPSLSLNIYQNSLKIDSQTLEAITPSIIKLNSTKYFSGVIAQSLKVLKKRTTRFDDKNLIVVLEIEAKIANLDDFSLEWVTRDGIDSSSKNLPYFKIFYYAIVPDYTKEFTFSYFDKDTNRFEKISLPIVVADEEISTQIDINPAKSSLQIYKDGAYGLVALGLILLFIKRRRKTYIVLLAMLVALFIYNKNPFNSVKVAKGSQMKILPIEKSTVFYVTSRTLYAQKLHEKDKYIKIILPNGKIGWIEKDEYDSKD